MVWNILMSNYKFFEINIWFFLLENIIRGVIRSNLGYRYVKSYENIKILYIGSNNLHGHSMSQPLPYDEIKLDKNVELDVY